MSDYAAQQMREQLARGPYEGEDFFRLQVTGDGKTKWVNVTPAQLAAIANVLDKPDPAPEPEGVIVSIKNIEPAWVEYGLTVVLPADMANLSDQEIEEEAMERLHASDSSFTVAYGPDVQGQIDSMDQEFTVDQIDRPTTAGTDPSPE